MKLNIRGDKVDITPAIKEYIETKVAKLDRYFETPDDYNAHVLVRIRGKEQIIEVTVPTKKFTLRAEEKHNDLYAAIDLVLDKLERQVRKNKTKLHKFKHEKVIEFSFDAIEEETSEESSIVKRKNVDSKPMSEEEALLQMELLNHDFFIFKNTDENCTSVIYARKDGHFGIINVNNIF